MSLHKRRKPYGIFVTSKCNVKEKLKLIRRKGFLLLFCFLFVFMRTINSIFSMHVAYTHTHIHTPLWIQFTAYARHFKPFFSNWTLYSLCVYMLCVFISHMALSFEKYQKQKNGKNMKKSAAISKAGQQKKGSRRFEKKQLQRKTIAIEQMHCSMFVFEIRKTTEG